MRARLMRLALAPLLLSMLLVPTYAGAQNGEISFPPIAGKWEGVVFFSGYYSTDFTRSDGSFGTSVTDVIDDTEITVEFVVGDNGQVTSGFMTVDLTYFDEGVGTSPAPTLDPYHVVHDHHQTGTLAIRGNAERLVASGTLTSTVFTEASGELVEGVGGTYAREVEWVFHAVEVNCLSVAAELVEASGASLMTTALAPRAIVEERRERINELVVQLWATPAEIEDPAAIKEAFEEITDLAELMSVREFPTASHLSELVKAWSDLRAELAQLGECQTAHFGWLPKYEKSWLVDILQGALHRALDNEDHYDAWELHELWIAGAHENALDLDLFNGFLDAFRAKLDEAIANNDTVTITDILAFAAANGIPDLTSKAKAALP